MVHALTIEVLSFRRGMLSLLDDEGYPESVALST